MLKIGKKNINVIAEDLTNILPQIVTREKEKAQTVIELPSIPDKVTVSVDTEYQDDTINLLIECVTTFIPELEDYFGDKAKCFFPTRRIRC